MIIYTNEENTVRIRKELYNVGARYFYYLEKWKSPFKLLFWKFGGKWIIDCKPKTATICDNPKEIISVWIKEYNLKKVD
jgi:hypothetical protein